MAKSDEERVREGYERGGAKGASEAIRDIERERDDREERVKKAHARGGARAASEEIAKIERERRERDDKDRKRIEREKEVVFLPAEEDREVTPVTAQVTPFVGKPPEEVHLRAKPTPEADPFQRFITKAKKVISTFIPTKEGIGELGESLKESFLAPPELTLQRDIALKELSKESPESSEYKKLATEVSKLEDRIRESTEGTPMKILKSLFVREGMTQEQVKLREKKLEGLTLKQRTKLAGRELASATPVLGTVLDWNRMSPTERALSLGIDGLILGAVAKPLVRAAIKPLASKTWSKEAVSKLVKDSNFNNELNKLSAQGKRWEKPLFEARQAKLNRLWREIDDAIRSGEKVRIEQAGRTLQAGAKPLELARAPGAKQLGTKGRSLEVRAGDISKQVKQAKTKPASSEAQQIENIWGKVSEAEISTAERLYRQTKGTGRRELLRKHIEQLKRVKKIAVKEALRPILRKIEWIEAGKYLPARVARKATNNLLKSKKIFQVKNKRIPLREFAKKKSVREVAKSYRVTVPALVFAVSNLPIQEQKLILAVHPEIKTALVEVIIEKEKISPALVEQIAEAIKTGTVVVPSKAIRETILIKEKEIATVEPAPAFAAVVKTKVTTPVDVKLLKKVKKIRPKIIPPPVILTDKKKEEEKARARIVPAAITWRQGIRWITIYPPFKSEADVKITRKPPAGAKVATGAGSAYKTIQSLSGNPTLVQVGIDMGMQDVFVRRKAGKASIRFRKDPHQRTRQDISLTGVRR